MLENMLDLLECSLCSCGPLTSIPGGDLICAAVPTIPLLGASYVLSVNADLWNALKMLFRFRLLALCVTLSLVLLAGINLKGDGDGIISAAIGLLGAVGILPSVRSFENIISGPKVRK